MREGWDRSNSEPELDSAILDALIQPAFPGARVVAVERAVGGLSNANTRLEITGRDRPILLRLCLREPASAAKEAAIATHIADRVPVARLLHFAESNPATGHPYLLLDWVEGQRLEIAAANAADADLAELGEAVGEALAAIGSITFDQAGFFDDGLGISRPFQLDGPGYLSLLGELLADGAVESRLGSTLTERLLSVARDELPALDRLDPTPRLVHCDFGGSNLLVRRESGRWTVAAVLDWEFAVSGPQIVDIGNLLRPPMGRKAPFADAFIRSYAAHGGALPEDWRRLASFVDMLAWVDFLNRPDPGARRIADSRKVIEATLADLDSDRRNHAPR